MVIENYCDIKISDFTLENVTPSIIPSNFLYVELNELKNNSENFPGNDEFSHGQAKTILPFARSGVIQATVKTAKILTNGPDLNKKVIEITFDLEISDSDLVPGDTIGILTHNRDDEVQFVLGSLGLQSKSDYVCKIALLPEIQKKSLKVPTYIPSDLKLRKILKDCVNLRSIPKKLFLRSLGEHTTDEAERMFLLYLSSKEGTKTYTEKILEKGVTFVDILKLCPSCRPPLSLLLEHLPRLLPRAYSIANNPLSREFDNEKEVKIIFSLLKSSPGLTTSFLEELATLNMMNSKTMNVVNLYLRERNNFSYTENEYSKNTIMISVGCAVAPFLGFMERRAEILKKGNFPSSSENWLFTGFQYPETSLYREQIQTYLQLGVIRRLFESFSRDEDADCKYVQDQIKRNSKEFIEFLLQPDTILYICADGSHISKSVQAAIQECLEKEQDLNSKEAREMILQFKKSGKYREDVWT